MATSTTHTTTDTCPRCSERVETTTIEAYCPECGLVVEDTPIDHGPDWTQYRNDEPNTARAYPRDDRRSDRGLGSERRSNPGDRTERRRDTVNEWGATSRDRTRSYACGEIHRVGVGVGLPRPVIERGQYLFRDYYQQSDLGGDDVDTIATAALYAACREHLTGRTAADLANVARCSERWIAQRVYQIAQTCGVDLPPPSLHARTRVVAARLGVDHATVRNALARLDGVEGTGAKPSGYAAAVLYLETDYTQLEVAAAAGVAARTVRDRRDEITE